MNKIPKLVHYCWYGNGEFSPLVKDCMETWKSKLPGYEIRRWDETNSPVNHPVIKKALDRNMWAFAADYMRLKALYDHGGVYLDTDMEIVKDFSGMLNHKLFFGYESDEHISAGIIGAVAGHPMIMKIMKVMEEHVERGEDFIAIPKLIGLAFSSLPEPNADEDGTVVYSREFFYPYNPYVMDRKQMIAADIKSNTYAIHHWEGSWVKKNVRKLIKKKIYTLLSRFN